MAGFLFDSPKVKPSEFFEILSSISWVAVPVIWLACLLLYYYYWKIRRPIISKAPIYAYAFHVLCMAGLIATISA